LADGSNGAIWFIYVLFFTELLFFGIEQLKNLLQSKWILFIFCLIATTIGWLLFQNSMHFFYKIEVVGMSLFFYVIGYITRMKGWYLKRWNFILLLFLAVVQFILANLQNRCLDMASNSYGTGLPSLLIALLGIGVTIECSKYIVKSPLWISNSIMYIGKNTIVVVGMSQMTLMGMKKYFELYEVPGYISSPVRHLLLWCLMVLFIYLFNKYIPFFIGKNSK
jgi:acyltransferase 3